MKSSGEPHPSVRALRTEALSLSEGEQTPSTRSVVEEAPIEEQKANLSIREQEVAMMVGRGLTNRQIAKELTISEHTVESHVRKTLKKLGCHSRV